MTTSRRWSCTGLGFARVAGLIAMSAGMTLLAAASAVGTLTAAGTCDGPSAMETRGAASRCPSIGRDVSRDAGSIREDLSGHRTPALIVHDALVTVNDVRSHTPNHSVESCLTHTHGPVALRAPPAFDSDPSDDTDDDDGGDGEALAPARITLISLARHRRVATIHIVASVIAPSRVSLLRGPPLS